MSEQLVTQSDRLNSKAVKASNRKDKSVRHDVWFSISESPVQHLSEDHGNSKKESRKPCSTCHARSGLHPPGFKELCDQMDEFSGRTGDCHFEL